LISIYPRAKFILFIDRGHSFGLDDADSFRALANADVLRVGRDDVCSWRALCEHLKIAPPLAAYPFVADKPPQKVVEEIATPKIRPSKRLRYDRSPWVVEPRRGWAGINAVAPKPLDIRLAPIAFSDSFDAIALDRWILRNDTFPGNLGLFRPANVAIRPSGGISLRVNQESLGVRDFSAASICSRDNFLYGRFEASLQATDVPGVVTGFFLHRNSPRQEIDVEIAGNRPDHLLVNVFFNPGSEGAKFDYGYRGSPVEIPLGFDASKGLHTFTIEWNTSQIRWFVDGELVHRRVSWNPTPIPHLPMQLHFNNWPTRSHQLAGRLVRRSLPTSAVVVSAAVDAQRSTSDFLTCK